MDSNLPPDNTPPPITPPPPIVPPRPPVYTAPPAPMPLPAPRRQSRGTGWKVFSIIVLILLVLSVLVNVSHVASSAFGGRATGYHNTYGPRLEEVTVRESSSTNKIVIVPIEGVISSGAMEHSEYSMVTIVKEQLKRAREDKEVKAVILKVDSPGGEVMASDDISKAITKFQDKSGKPVIVSMGGMAASGGYYVSAPCDWIVANELTITGSIGVIMSGFNYRGLLDKIGVRPQVFKSGKFKDMMSPTKTPEEITQDEKDMIQNLINETFGKFKSVVSEGRHAAYQNNKHQGKALSPDWEDVADGRILSGKEAYKLGFVDELGDFEVAVDRAKQLAHIKKGEGADLIEYQPAFDLANLFRMFGESNTKSVKVELGVDLPKLHAGYMYFLSSTYLQ